MRKKSDFLLEIDSCLVNKQRRSELVNLFFSKRSSLLRFIVGRNDESINLINHIKIDRIIDDFWNSQDHWMNIPIYKMKDVPKDALIAICSTSISTISVKRKLVEYGLNNIIYTHEVFNNSIEDIDTPLFVKQTKNDYLKNKLQWLDLFNILADHESKKTLLNILRFRSTANPFYLCNYCVRLNEQYFEPFLDLDKEIFVDAGGFNGETTEIFCSTYPNYRKVFLFEPSKKNLELAKKKLKGQRDIHFFSEGLSDKSGILHFDANSGPASAISDSNASLPISVTTLDEIITEPVSFIKMDLEGWELNALIGSKNHIITDRPKLAISVYHHAKDFRLIKDFLLSLDVNYRVYLRHYTEGWSETVMYFVPKLNIHLCAI